ncbi:MAG TPA: Crp/Fnr family transcriptional regulator [Brevundimonas sp.]|jgi:CRP-like cAMP-binding protein
MIERHLMKLRARTPLSADEEATIRAAVSGTRRLKPDEILVRAFERVEVSSILVSGFAARVRQLADGRRQTSELHTPGDFADLHSFTLKYLDHDIVAMTECEFAIVPHERLHAITEQHPRLTRIYWFATNLDAAIHRELVVSLGRREATSRMAHLFCELHIRLGLVGLVENDAFDLPLTQAEMAECLGLSSVHVNRTLMQLRASGLVEWTGKRVSIHDLDGLRRTADFDPGYLHLDKIPR